MVAWTLETAKKHLDAWLSAELAITTGQSYWIGTRKLERANLSEVKNQIRFWRAEVEKLSSGRKGRNRVIGVIPRDF